MHDQDRVTYKSRHGSSRDGNYETEIISLKVWLGDLAASSTREQKPVLAAAKLPTLGAVHRAVDLMHALVLTRVRLKK